MPNGVTEFEALPNIKDDADTIGDATSGQKPQAAAWKVFNKRFDAGQHGPSHQEIKTAIEPIAFLQKPSLKDNAENGDRPDEREKRDPCHSFENDKTKRRVAACDKHIDHRMV